MKKLYILLICISCSNIIVTGQSKINLQNFEINSSILDFNTKQIPINLNYGSNDLLTLQGDNNDWWQIKFDSTYDISQINLFVTSNTDKFYLILSSNDLDINQTSSVGNGQLISETLLTNINATYFEIEYTGSNIITIDLEDDNTANYITIIPTGVVGVNEIEVDGGIREFGTGGNGPGFDTNDDLNDGVEFGLIECSDGIDNDNDGLTDCEEFRCAVQKVNITYTPPSCGVCDDGEICVQAFNINDNISFDGGNTWLDLEDGANTCFSNFSEGQYDIYLVSPSGCPYHYSVELSVPRGPVGFCENGGFEDSSFENWTGGAGTISQGIDNESFIADRHEIIRTEGFVDPLIASINGDLPDLGLWIARLGNDKDGGQRERLKYCFVVDNDNKNFKFNYAFVFEDPDHDESDNPQLRWRIYPKYYPILPIVDEVTFSSDPFIDRLVRPEPAEVLAYKGWTCQGYDLSDYIGQELCIQFDNFDCSQNGYFGYTYIDGLCGEGLEPNPTIDIASDVFCFNQKISVAGKGAGFNQFTWDLKIVNGNGLITHSFEIDKEIGYFSDIQDLIGFIEGVSVVDVACDSKITIGFTGYNDCSNGVRVEKTIDYICSPDYKIEYCDPLYICGGNNTKEVKIIGDISCDGCQFSWTSSGNGGISGTSEIFPTVSENDWFGAFENDYYVEAITPEGCIYFDTVRIDFTPSQIFIEPLEQPCSMEVTVRIVNLERPIDELSFIDRISGEEYNLGFDDDLSSENELVFTTIIERDVDKDLVLNFGEDSDLSCYTQDIFECTWENELFINATSSNFQEPWIVYKPNSFTPLCDVEEHMDFYLANETYETDYTNNQTICDSLAIGDFDNSSVSVSSIYYYRLQVYDRPGGLVFDEEVSIPTTSIAGIDISTVKWNGYINGQIGSSAVYAYKATIKSCYSGLDLDQICSFSSNFETGNEETTIIVGDVGLFYWHPICLE